MPRTAGDVARAFNAAINARDIVALGALMSEDHCFIDPAGAEITGKADCLLAWSQFFDAFGDYRNYFEQLDEFDEWVVATGHSTCSNALLEGPALWRARVMDGKVTVWQVAEETPATRQSFGLACRT